MPPILGQVIRQSGSTKDPFGSCTYTGPGGWAVGAPWWALWWYDRGVSCLFFSGGLPNTHVRKSFCLRRAVLPMSWLGGRVAASSPGAEWGRESKWFCRFTYRLSLNPYLALGQDLSWAWCPKACLCSNPQRVNCPSSAEWASGCLTVPLNLFHDSPCSHHLSLPSEETISWVFPGGGGARWFASYWLLFSGPIMLTLLVHLLASFQHLLILLHMFSLSPRFMHTQKIPLLLCKWSLNEEEINSYIQSAMFNWKLSDIVALFIFFNTFLWVCYE